MLLPIMNDREEELYLEPWARAVVDAVPEPTFKVGDRVYCVLYGTKYGYCPYGTVVDVAPGGTGLLVEDDRGGTSGSWYGYYRALPPEHDPKLK